MQTPGSCFCGDRKGLRQGTAWTSGWNTQHPNTGQLGGKGAQLLHHRGYRTPESRTAAADTGWGLELSTELDFHGNPMGFPLHHLEMNATTKGPNSVLPVLTAKSLITPSGIFTDPISRLFQHSSFLPDYSVTL